MNEDRRFPTLNHGQDLDAERDLDDGPDLDDDNAFHLNDDEEGIDDILMDED